MWAMTMYSLLLSCSLSVSGECSERGKTLSSKTEKNTKIKCKISLFYLLSLTQRGSINFETRLIPTKISQMERPCVFMKYHTHTYTFLFTQNDSHGDSRVSTKIINRTSSWVTFWFRHFSFFRILFRLFGGVIGN